MRRVPSRLSSAANSSAATAAFFLTSFRRAGYTVVEGILSPGQCDELVSALPPIDTSGSRRLLAERTFQNLAAEIRNFPALQSILADLVAVQCTLFRKTRSHNWAVRLHRDTVVPIRGSGSWKSAGVKEQMSTAKPPREFLDECVVVRVHLDGAPDEDISVVPGSHKGSETRNRSDAVPIPVPRGGGLVLRPTLAHASSKLRHSENRRVLHYLFASPDAPSGYRWYYAV